MKKARRKAAYLFLIFAFFASASKAEAFWPFASFDIKPDSPIYFLDRFFEDLTLAFTFDKAKKLKKLGEINQERLEEYLYLKEKESPELEDFEKGALKENLQEIEELLSYMDEDYGKSYRESLKESLPYKDLSDLLPGFDEADRVLEEDFFNDDLRFDDSEDFFDEGLDLPEDELSDFNDNASEGINDAYYERELNDLDFDDLNFDDLDKDLEFGEF